MKIIQPIPLAFPVKAPQIVSYKRYNNEGDVFTPSQSTQTPAFKANSSNIYKKILDNPSLSQKFMGLVSAAAAALIGAAQLEDDEVESVDGNNAFLNLFQGNLNNSSTVKNLESQIKEYEEENKNLKQRIEELESQKNTEYIPTQENESQNDALICVFNFPKKWGKLSVIQKDLKDATNGLTLREKSSEKLMKICTQALIKGVIDDDKIVQFTEKILNNENKEQTIDEFYLNLYGQEQESKQSSIKTKVSVPSTKATNDPSSEEEITIDLKDNNSFMYKVPVAYSTDIHDALESLMKKFQQEIYDSYKSTLRMGNAEGLSRPKWKYNRAVSERVLTEDVKNEIRKKNSSPESKFIRIAKEDPEYLADIINSDERFHSLFTIHSALRLLERYVNFNNDVSPEEQCHVILDKIEDLVMESLKTGIKIDVYSENGYYAPRIIIPYYTFSSDPEAQKIFGTHDLYIAFTESQSSYSYVPSYNKKALIATMYSR